jgi:two-component system, OmpR family, sensor kinase
MKFFHSIRWRLQLWHGLLLVVVLAGFGFTAHQLQRSHQMRQIDQELQVRLSVLGGALRQQAGPRRPPPDVRPPGDAEGARDESPPRRGGLRLFPRDERLFETTGTNDFYFVIWSRNDRVLASSASAPADVSRPELDEKAHSARMRGTARELYHYTPPGECILVGRDIRPELAEMRLVAGSLLVAGCVVLALGLAGGAWLATRAIRPVQTISATAAKIATGDLAQRIPSAETESELGQLTAVLNSTFAQLEAAFAQQVRFTADAAHELRTPISVVLTQTQAALNRQRPAGEYREALEACQRAAQRMRVLAESLLRLAKLDAHREPLKSAPVDLSKIAAECVEMLRPLATARGVTIHSDLPQVVCAGDTEQLSQVITNLVTNAIQYNIPNGGVHLKTEQHDGMAVLTVTDTGIGIPPEALDHIFERFFRVDNARSSSGGAGLGLAIAKAIVSEHGGTISVSSRPGTGSTFTVRLPLSPEPQMPNQSQNHNAFVNSTLH